MSKAFCKGGVLIKALLVLEDGFALQGKAFAGSGEVYGEAVFNTSMTGYQEILTDPSYKGQLVTMTYPLIGNYGVNDADREAARVQAQALIVREYSPLPSNWRSQMSLADYLNANGVLGVEEIDTRALTRHLRELGAMRAALSTVDLDYDSLLSKVRQSPVMAGQNLVQYVTRADVETAGQGKHHVVLMDFGSKERIKKRLLDAGCTVTVVPAQTTARQVLSYEPDGILLSNGPGDPAALPEVIAEVRKLLGRKPMFGICLGHQLLGLAMGFDTFKLKFGHRGGNHPVKDFAKGRVEITAQNHGFCLAVPGIERIGHPDEARALGDEKWRITHLNLNDLTIEGMAYPQAGCFSVQFHPEAAPGPHDATGLFNEFVRLMEGGVLHA